MLRKLLALSRSTHGVMDMAMPGCAALLWLGTFPAWDVLLVSIVTVAAGYTAIYALNDLVGFRADREKFSCREPNAGYSVESSEMRYPIARGKLRLRLGVLWFVFWFAVTLSGAWWLNPWLLPVVLAAPLLEALYCALLKVTWWRVLVSGVVKSLGPVAAVLVVVPQPHPGGLALMVLWVMAWEIGGQNIPADWNDVEEDRRIGARTIPVIFGAVTSARTVVLALLTTVALSLALPWLSPLQLGWTYQLVSGWIGLYLLLLPAFALWRSRDGRLAARLFDRASWYPVAQLLLVLVFVVAA